MNQQEALSNYARYASDPWAFLSECVFTRDAVDENEPIKRFPAHYDYLRLFTRIWQQEKMLAVPKSRRMTMSWTCIALTVWDVLFHKGKEWAFVSKKEDDSLELVSRALFIYNRIPPERIPKALLPKIKGKRMTKSPPRLEFDFGDDTTSYIQGFPMGADQLRQFTFSGIFGDECAFWEVAEEFYTGAKPTTDGGGRMVLVSSRSPSFFKKLVYDKVNEKSLNFPEIAPSEVKRPMSGIEVWKNPKNKFCVMDIHYTANPDKRSEEFKDALKATLPMHQYLREYERSWNTFAGMPVYPNFRSDIHLPAHKLEAHLGLPLMFGWDFGLTPSCIVGQIQGNSLKILREFVAQNESIKTFAPKVMSEVKALWPEWCNYHKDHFHFVDPAGFKRNENDERTCVLEMQEAVSAIKNIEPGPVTFTARTDAVNKYLLYIDKDGAGLEIAEKHCPVLTQGFRGGYRYADSQAEIEADRARPIKNAYSHPHDALQYLAHGATLKTTEYTLTGISTPSYGFQKTESDSGRTEYGRKL